MDLDDPLEQATYFFILNRTSFSGSTLSGGFSQESSKKRFTQSSIQRVQNLSLESLQFFNMDFEPFLEEVATGAENPFIFLDPPYFLEGKSQLYGYKGNMHKTFEHERLHRSLANHDN